MRPLVKLDENLGQIHAQFLQRLGYEADGAQVQRSPAAETR